jgi:hypothetical protein
MYPLGKTLFYAPEDLTDGSWAVPEKASVTLMLRSACAFH